MLRAAAFMILLILSTSFILYAQEDFPIIIQDREGTYSRDGSDSICPFGPASPNGHYVAYLETAPFMQAYFDSGNFFGGAPTAHNNWLCEISTGNRIQLSEQPPEAAIDDPEKPDRWIGRSNITWSADGTQVAWTEVDYPPEDNNVNRLIVYDLATNEERILTDEIDGPPTTSALQSAWITDGIAVLTDYFDRELRDFKQTIQLYSVDDGQMLQETLISDREAGAYSGRIWTLLDGRHVLAVEYENLGWTLLDPVSGESSQMAGKLELFNPQNPNGTSVILINQEPTFEWNIVLAGIPQTLTFQAGIINDIGISSNGEIAFKGNDGVYIWSGAGYEPVEFTLDSERSRYIADVMWGPVAYRIFSDRDLNTICEGFIESRLVVGQNAYEVTGTASNLRSGPGVSYEQIGQIPGSATFAVLQGPVCADGYAWWQIDYEGNIGWTAEGEGETYWLAPVEA